MDSKDKLRNEFENYSRKQYASYSSELEKEKAYSEWIIEKKLAYEESRADCAETEMNMSIEKGIEIGLEKAKQDTIKEVIKLIDERVEHYKGERKACLKENFQPPYELKIGIQELESLLKLIKMTEDK